MSAPRSASPPAVRGAPVVRRAKRTAGTRPIAQLLERLLADGGPARWP